MTIEPRSPYRIRVTLPDGRRLLGLPTGVPQRGYPAQRIAALAKAGGVVVEGGRTRPWPIERVAAHDGTLWLCGPEIEGAPLAERLDGADDAAGDGVDPPGWLAGMVRNLAALAAMEGHDVPPEAQALVQDDGSLLALDAQLARHLATTHSGVTPHHPAEVGRRAVRRALLRRDTGAEVPTARDSADRDETGGAPRPIDEPVHLRRPEIAPELAALLDASPPSGHTPDAEAYLRSLAGALEAPIVDAASADLLEQRRDDAARRHAAATTRVTRTAWWRRNRTTLVASAVAAATVLWIAGTIVAGALQPPVTAGMEPLQVVAHFFDAWDRLDHDAADDALARGVGEGYINQMINVYVVSRVQQAQMFDTSRITASEWLALGRPSDRVPYGPTDVRLSGVRARGDQRVVEAQFRLWVAEPVGDDGLVAYADEVRERYVLSPVRHGWEITAIEPISVAPRVDEQLLTL